MEEANTNYIVLMEPQQSQNGSEIEVLEFFKCWSLQSSKSMYIFNNDIKMQCYVTIEP